MTKLNLTEAEIMKLVDLLRSDAYIYGACGMRPQKIEETLAELQAIAAEYEKRGKERDKLLERLRETTNVLWEVNDAHVLLEGNDKLIAEIEK